MHTVPAAPVMILRRSADDATASFLHDVFLHMSMEKIYQTLGVTQGYKQVRFKDFHCDSCARAKARNFGLKQGVQHAPNLINLNEELPDDFSVTILIQITVVMMTAVNLVHTT